MGCLKGYWRVFERPKAIRHKGHILNVVVRCCSPAVADIAGAGEEEFFIGDEDGRIRLYRRDNPRLEPWRLLVMVEALRLYKLYTIVKPVF